MCGIVIWYASGQVSEQEMSLRVSHALRAMKHRGPDDEGIHVVRDSENRLIGMGSVRLAIQDVTEAGHQPMSQGPVSVALNGELYNHRTLRKTDAPVDWTFIGGSDTETLLACWHRRAASTVSAIRGMFALAAFDERSQTLSLARDHLGVKPLYIASGPFGVAAASELRALHALNLVPKVPRKDAIDAYLQFGCVPSPMTIWRGISCVPAASVVTIRSAEVAACNQFWDPTTLSRSSGRFEPETLHSLLEQSVGEQLLSDVPVAVLLSGGIDSSIVAALASGQARSPVTAFTVGFEDSSADETVHASAVARQYGLRHKIVRLSASQIRTQIGAALGRMDSPSADGFNTVDREWRHRRCGLQGRVDWIGRR